MTIASALCALQLSAVEPAAQALGDAAAKAGSDTRERSAVQLTERDVAGPRYWEITPAGLSLYASIRAELTAHRRARPDLHTRLFDASRTVTRLSGMQRVLAREPIVVEVLRRYRVTPAEYLQMDQAILTAAYWAARRTPRSLQRQLIHMGNVRFMREQARLVRQETARYGGAQWYDEKRFIEQF